MNQTKLLQWLIWGVLVVLIAAIILAYLIEVASSKSPQVRSDGSLPIIKTLTSFSLTNQFGAEFTLDHLKGTPWVANIFFTRCPSICAQMTQKMKSIQDAIGDDFSLRLVSITTDPLYDHPEILRRYAKRFGADTTRWSFLTGDRASISRVIQKQLLLALAENPEDTRQSKMDLYTHSSLIVLVDASSQMRATYESMQTNVIESLIADLDKLD